MRKIYLPVFMLLLLTNCGVEISSEGDFKITSKEVLDFNEVPADLTYTGQAYEIVESLLLTKKFEIEIPDDYQVFEIPAPIKTSTTLTGYLHGATYKIADTKNYKIIYDISEAEISGCDADTVITHEMLHLLIPGNDLNHETPGVWDLNNPTSVEYKSFHAFKVLRCPNKRGALAGFHG